MPDVAEQIRSYYEAASEPIGIGDVTEPGAVLAPSRPRSLPGPMIALAAAAIVVVVGGIVTLLVGRDAPEVVSTPPPATTTPPPTTDAPETTGGPAAIGAWRWEEVSGDEATLPWGPIVADAQGFVSVSDGAVWRSADGLAWEQVETLEDPAAWLADVGDATWAVTERSGVSRLWVLGAGGAEELALPVEGVLIGRPVVGVEGMVAVPVTGGDGHSLLVGGADGLGPVDVPWVADGGQVAILGGPEAFVAIWWEPGSGEAARTWTSADGGTWLEQPSPFDGGSVDSLGAGGSGPFFVETVRTEGEVDIARTWRSDSGETWVQAGVSSADGTGSFLGFDPGIAFISFTYTELGDSVAVSVSADGETWEDVSDPMVALGNDDMPAGLGWWAAGDRVFVAVEWAEPAGRTLWVGGPG